MGDIKHQAWRTMLVLVFLVCVTLTHGRYLDNMGDSEDRCSTVQMDLCREIPYNQTLIGATEQRAAEAQLNRYLPLFTSECSPHLGLFMCSIHAPVCTILMQPILPCRGLCQRVFQGCSKKASRLENPEIFFKTLDCQQFPPGGLCISSPQL